MRNINPLEYGFDHEGEETITAFEFLGYTFEVDPENARFLNLDLPGEFITFEQFEALDK